MPSEFDLIPEDRRDDARAALSAVGDAPVTSVAPITGGVSALTFRVELRGRAYALRLEGPRGGLRDPVRSYACLRLASEAGVAPGVRYADPATGVAVLDFISQRSLAEYPGGPVALAGAFGGLAERLQQIPDFPAFVDYQVLLGRMLDFISGAGLFAPGLLDAHMDAFRRLSQAYPWDREGMVASHNDPNPRNVLFDGERLWLIDWETAFRNDPLVDLAIMANELAPTPELETALLSGWRSAAPDAHLRARLTLMRQFARLYYACLLLSPFAMQRPPAPDGDLSALTVAKFTEAVARGRLKLGSPELVYALGKMNLAGFLGWASGDAVAVALADLGQG